MQPKLHILVVDDDERMTHTLSDILSVSGYVVVKADSGMDALEKIRSTMFDCVLTDVRMPGMDGVELHRQLRQIQPGLPVLLMTAYAADTLIRQGIEEGVVGVFDKPLDMTQLLGFLNTLAKARTIVIVDNDPDFCKTLEDILCNRGFKVSQIIDPHVSIDVIISNAQIILLDLHLNHITGLDVLKKIHSQCPALPVLLVTGHRNDMADVIQEALELNGYPCFYKPLEISKLLQTLSQIQLNNLRAVLDN